MPEEAAATAAEPARQHPRRRRARGGFGRHRVPFLARQGKRFTDHAAARAGRGPRALLQRIAARLRAWRRAAPPRSASSRRSSGGGTSPTPWRARPTRSPRRATTCCSTTSPTPRPATGSSSACRSPAASTPCSPMTMPLTEEHTLALRALDMPFVTLGARIPDVPCVRIDDAAAMRTAVHHLLHQGHEQIAMIAGIEDDRAVRLPLLGRPPPRLPAGALRRRAGAAPGALGRGGVRDRGRRAGDGRADGGPHPAHRRGRRVRRAGHRRAAHAAAGQRGGAGPGLGGRAGRPRDGLGRGPHHRRPARARAGCAGRAAAAWSCWTARSTGDLDVVVPTRLVVRGTTAAPIVRAVDGGC